MGKKIFQNPVKVLLYNLHREARISSLSFIFGVESFMFFPPINNGKGLAVKLLNLLWQDILLCKSQQSLYFRNL